MDLKADIIFQEVSAPEDLWCECGHTAPAMYKRAGPNSELLPIRFWHMKGRGVDRIICEPCMTIINWKAALDRKKRKLNGQT